MSEPEGKAFASLNPGLLARKGAARPAMRPQHQPLHAFHEATARQLEEDLGWNDMGEDVEPQGHVQNPLVGLTPSPHLEVREDAEVVPIKAEKPEVPPTVAPVPEVVRQREEVAERVAAAAPVVATPVVAVPAAKPQAVVAPVAVKTPPRREKRRASLADGRKAAFTLRLDAERHLKLRLACAVAGRSAQAVVTEALDQLISSLPDIDSLAEQVRKRK